MAAAVKRGRSSGELSRDTMAAIMRMLDLVGRASGAATRVAWDAPGKMAAGGDPLEDLAGSATKGWQENSSFSSLFPELVRGTGELEGLGDLQMPTPTPFGVMHATPKGTAQVLGLGADMLAPGPGELAAAPFALMHLLGGNKAGTLADFARMFGRTGELESAGKLTQTGPEDVQLFLQKRAREAGVKPPATREAAAEMYRASLADDVPAALEGGIVTPEKRDFYRIAAEDRPGFLADLALMLQVGGRHPRAASVIGDPRIASLQSAVQAAASNKNSPRLEQLAGAEGFVELLDRYLGGQNVGELVPRFKSGTFNEALGEGTAWSAAGTTIPNAWERIMELVDSMPAAAREEKLMQASEWFGRRQPMQDVMRVAGHTRPGDRLRPFAERTGMLDANAIVPQALDVPLDQWKSGTVPGWFGLGPKTGAYGSALSGDDFGWAVHDTHGRRGLGARTLRGFSPTSRPGEYSGPAEENEFTRMLAGAFRSGDPAAVSRAREGAGLELIDLPGSSATGDRWIYQHGMQGAADELGLGVDQVQAVDWYLKKHLDAMLGVNTPGGTSISGLQEALENARTTGEVYPARTPYIPPKGTAADKARKGKYDKRALRELEKVYGPRFWER